MSDVQLALKRSYKYKKRKPIPKKYLITSYILIAFVFAFSLLTKNKFLLFIFVTFFSTLINYQTNLPTIRFNPDPEVFFGLLIARVIGFRQAVIMLFVPTLIVDCYTYRLDKDTFVSYFLTAAICYIMAQNPGSNFVELGIILVTARFILGLFLNIIMKIVIHEIVFEHILGYVNNLIIFFIFGEFLIGLFG